MINKEKVLRKQFELLIEINNINHPIKVNERIKNKLIEGKTSFIQHSNDKIIVKSTFFDESLVVKNVCRHILTKQDNKFKLSCPETKHKDFVRSKYNDYPIIEKSILPSIIIVLESPHQDEYIEESEKIISIAPAQGDTGTQIAKKIHQIINNNKDLLEILDRKEYRVLIINPVPYQTSLYLLHKQSLSGVYKKLRDKVWLELWQRNENLKESFINLLNNIKPKLILNCGTANVSKHISEALITTKFEVFVVRHPSSWFSNKEIVIKKYKSI